MRARGEAFAIGSLIPRAALRRIAAVPPSPTDPLDAAWSSLLAEWESDERHRAFVALASTLERLPDAARRYRALTNDAHRGARARQGLDRVLGMAMQALTPPPRESRPKRNLLLPAGAFLALLIVTIAAAQATGVRALTSPWIIFAEAVLVAIAPWHRLGEPRD